MTDLFAKIQPVRTSQYKKITTLGIFLVCTVTAERQTFSLNIRCMDAVEQATAEINDANSLHF